MKDLRQFYFVLNNSGVRVAQTV